MKVLLREVANGKIPERASFRRRDFFKDLCGELNEMFAFLRYRKRTLTELVDALDKAANESSSSEDKNKIKKIVEKLREL